MNRESPDESGGSVNAGAYSIADMACYPWIVPHERQQQDITQFPYLHQWFQRIHDREAVQRAYAKALPLENTPVPPDANKILFGQTAQTIGSN